MNVVIVDVRWCSMNFFVCEDVSWLVQEVQCAVSKYVVMTCIIDG
jgi:hypothetical protein